MRLRKPCEHDRYEEHPILSRIAGRRFEECPGGEFLPEGALVIEKDADGGWPTALSQIAEDWSADYVMDGLGTVADLFAALALGDSSGTFTNLNGKS